MGFLIPHPHGLRHLRIDDGISVSLGAKLRLRYFYFHRKRRIPLALGWFVHNGQCCCCPPVFCLTTHLEGNTQILERYRAMLPRTIDFPPRLGRITPARIPANGLELGFLS